MYPITLARTNNNYANDFFPAILTYNFDIKIQLQYLWLFVLYEHT